MVGMGALGERDRLDGNERHQHPSRLRRVTLLHSLHLQSGVRLWRGVFRHGPDRGGAVGALHWNRLPRTTSLSVQP